LYGLQGLNPGNQVLFARVLRGIVDHVRSSLSWMVFEGPAPGFSRRPAPVLFKPRHYGTDIVTIPISHPRHCTARTISWPLVRLTHPVMPALVRCLSHWSAASVVAAWMLTLPVSLRGSSSTRMDKVGGVWIAAAIVRSVIVRSASPPWTVWFATWYRSSPR